MSKKSSVYVQDYQTVIQASWIRYYKIASFIGETGQINICADNLEQVREQLSIVREGQDYLDNYSSTFDFNPHSGEYTPPSEVKQVKKEIATLKTLEEHLMDSERILS